MPNTVIAITRTLVFDFMINLLRILLTSPTTASLAAQMSPAYDLVRTLRVKQNPNEHFRITMNNRWKHSVKATFVSRRVATLELSRSCLLHPGNTCRKDSVHHTHITPHE